MERRRGELLDAAPRTADRQVPHLAGRPAAPPEPDELVVGPAGAVDEQAGTVLELGTHHWRQLLQYRQGDQRPAAPLVGESVANDPPLPGTGAGARIGRAHV